MTEKPLTGENNAAERTAPDADDTALVAWRKEFPILADSVYLVSHSMGAMPRGARRRLERYADMWAARGIAAWDAWYPMILEHGNRIGALFGAEPDCVALHQNVSVLMSVALSCFDPSPRRNRIVYTTLNFPTNHYIVQSDPRFEMRRVPSPDGATVPTEAFIQAIDETTLAVIIDHGIYVSGALQDVKAITEAAHRSGAVAIVDAYQTVGVVPIDVKAWGCDFLLGGSHKWLCGGPGTAFLYTRPGLLPSLTPKLTGWMAQKDVFAFADEAAYPDNALRFIGGTASMAAYHASREGVEILNQVGVEAVRARSLRLTSRIMALADERGLAVRTPRDAERRGGVVCIDFEGAERAERELVRRRFFCDYRPNCGIRLSGHFYNTMEEMDLFFEALDRVRKGD